VSPEEKILVDQLIKSMSNKSSIGVALTDCPKVFWRAVLDEPNLTPGVRSSISLFVFGMSADDVDLDKAYDIQVESPIEFGNALQLLTNSRYNVEFLLNGRWYPIRLGVKFHEDAEKVVKCVSVCANLIVGDRNLQETHYITKDTFLNEFGAAQSLTVIELLELKGFRRLQTPAADFNLKLVRAQHASNTPGQVVLISNSVVASDAARWWQSINVRPLGTAESPAVCIVDADLECEGEGRYVYHQYRGDNEGTLLPFVRVFSLETKDFVYADVDDVAEYEFDTQAMSRLHLPKKMHSILQRVFEAPVDNMFGDVLPGKHGGVVVLASGRPGVGKTLTAEIYAQCTQRPLYVLELGELGTSAAEVESNLQSVFSRVTRWNAVLQFDECEIFLAKRNNDLERSAIVGIFLRLLDYYRGLLFLTTNRPEVLDEAVLSRIMLRLEYPDLDNETRGNVWRTMFEQAGLTLVGRDFDDIGTIELNGRQIRNLTRLALILNPDKTVTAEKFEELIKFGVS